MLSAAESDRIATAVAAAEARTSTEILCVLSREASEYREAPLAWAAGAALLAPLAATAAGLSFAPLAQRLSGWAAAHGSAAGGPLLTAYALAQAAVFLIVLVVASIPRVRLALTPGVLKRHRAHRAALQQFAAARAHLRPGETAVMIFAALGERQVEVLADEAVHAAVGQAAWDRAVAEAVAAIRAEGPVAGLVRAVEICGAALAESFPAQERANAYPDRPLEI